MEDLLMPSCSISAKENNISNPVDQYVLSWAFKDPEQEIKARMISIINL
jgi:hypothetical protein